jgi:hypothetical protein
MRRLYATYLKQEVENIIEACNAIGSQLAADSLPPLTPKFVCDYNLQVLNRLPLKEDVVPGKLRPYLVVVGNVYRGAPAEDCDHLLEQLCTWLNGPDFKPREGMDVVYAILKAVVAHLYLAWIHPFGDGNGRTARLLEFHILLSAGVPSPAAHLFSNHYNLTRAEYYRQLDYASKSGGRSDLLPELRRARIDRWPAETIGFCVGTTMGRGVAQLRPRAFQEPEQCNRHTAQALGFGSWRKRRLGPIGGYPGVDTSACQGVCE